MREKIGEGYVEARVDQSRVGGDLAAVERTVQQRFQQMGRDLQRTGRTMTRRLTLPIVGAGTAIARVAGDFESSMNRVGALTNTTGEQFDRLRSLAMELGRTTQFSASQAADGMGYLAMAGFEVDEILAAMPGTLQLAAAGQLDLARAADITSNVLQGFGLEATEVGRVNDVLAYTASNANTDINQLGDALSYAAPIATAAGWSVEQVAAAVGGLSDAGIQGSRAGTTLVAAIAALESQSGPARARLDELGIATHDAAGQLLPLADIIEQLEDVGLSAGDALDIFGRRGGPGMAALIETGSASLRDMGTALEDAGGTAQRMADRQMEGLRGAMLRMRSAAEGAAIAIADSGFLDALAGLAERAADTFQRLSEANPELLKFATIAAGALAAAGPVLWAVGAALSALGVFLSPAGLIIGGLALLGGAFVNAAGEGDSFLEKLVDVATRLGDRFGPAIDWVVDKIQGVAGWFGWSSRTSVDEMRDLASGVSDQTLAIAETLGGDEFAGAITSIAGEFAEMRADALAEMQELRIGIETALTDAAVRAPVPLDQLAADVGEKLGRMREIGTDHFIELRDRGEEAIRQLVERGAITIEEADGMIRRIHHYTSGAMDEFDELTAKVEDVQDIMGDEQQWQAAVQQGFAPAMDEAVRTAAEASDEVIAAMVRQRDGSRAELELLAAESDSITKEAAAAVIANSAQQRDETIAQSKQQTEQTIAEAWAAYEAEGGISADKRDELIANAIEQHNGVVSEAEQMHLETVGEVSGMRDGVRTEVNLMTGEVLSGWDRFARDYRIALGVWVDHVLDSWANFGRNLTAAVSGTWSGIQRAISDTWNGILSDAGHAVNNIIGLVNGLIGGVNAVSQALGLGDLVREIGTVNWGRVNSPQNRAQNAARAGHQEFGDGPGYGWDGAALPTFHGGGIVGDGGLRTSGPLRPGERVIRALDGEEVLTLNDPRHRESHPETGGLRERVDDLVNKVRDFTSAKASRARKTIAEVARPLVESSMGSLEALASRHGFVGRIAGAAGRRLGQGALDWLSGVDAEAEKRETPELGPGIGWRAMWQAVQSQFPWARLTSAYRPGAITATGNPSYHGMGRAVDLGGRGFMNHPDMLRIARWIYDNYKGQTRELIYSRGPQIHNGRDHYYTGVTRRNHFDHVHWAMGEGAVIDAPTLGILGENASSNPEIVTPHRLLEETFRRVLREEHGGGGHGHDLYLDGVLVGQARSVNDGIARESRRRARLTAN